MGSLSNKVAFITGAASGVGAEVARQLRAAGVSLVLTDIDERQLADRAAEYADDDQVLTRIADVRDLTAMQAAATAAVAKFGGIDIVIANAGIASYGSMLAVDPEAFSRVIDINVLGVFHAVRATLPAVIQRRGYVLVVSSGAAFTGWPGSAAYNASKAAAEHLANTLRVEVAHLGVDVGCAHMSWVDTPLLREAKADLSALRELLRTLPRPMRTASSVEHCGAAFIKGIERRKDRVYCPGWIGTLRWLRPLAATPLGERGIRKATPELLQQLDAEVIALGRSTSARAEAHAHVPNDADTPVRMPGLRSSGIQRDRDSRGVLTAP